MEEEEDFGEGQTGTNASIGTTNLTVITEASLSKPTPTRLSFLRQVSMLSLHL